MKIKEWNQTMAYLTRREPSAKESKGTYDKFVKEGKDGYAPPAPPKRDIHDYINQVQHTYDGVALNKNNKKINAVAKRGQAKVKPVKVKPARVNHTKPVQLEFSLLDDLTNSYEPMFNYEPVQTPIAKPRDHDLDKGIASILAVKGGKV
tara:strand:+ start:211 stop:657 length:447 start_codon:yes stop_codon:yes gene_type:complete